MTIERQFPGPGTTTTAAPRRGNRPPRATYPCPTYTLRQVAPGWAEGAVRTYVVQDNAGEVVGMMQIARALDTQEFCDGIRRALEIAGAVGRPALSLVVADAAARTTSRPIPQ